MKSQEKRDVKVAGIAMRKGHIDPERLTALMRGARLHYGRCVRELPADWPATRLPPLPAGIAPGLAVAHDVAPIGASQEARNVR